MRPRAFFVSGAVRRLGRLRGPWHALVAEESMVPALEPGDRLLLDPTVRHWPRPGSVVVVREPATEVLVVKRVRLRGPGAIETSFGTERVAAGEAWLEGDGAASVDSRRYGPLTLDRLVARAWFRYAPPGRIGRLRRD